MKRTQTIILLCLLSAVTLHSYRFRFKNQSKLPFLEEALIQQKLYRNNTLFKENKLKTELSVEQRNWKKEQASYAGTISYYSPDNNGEFIKRTSRSVAFSRNKFGNIKTLDGQQFSPRENFPTFPKQYIRKLKSWNAPVIENFNLRPFGFNKLLKTKANVTYRYIRDQQLDGYKVAVILYLYAFSDKQKGVTASGNVVGILFWNKETGMPQRLSESFNFTFKLDDGRIARSDGLVEKSFYPLTAAQMKKLKMRKQLRKFLGKGFKLRIAKDGVVVNLGSILFDTGKWDLKPKGISRIANIAAFLKKAKKMKIKIDGHTDNQGKRRYNLNLSRKRAHAVYSYLQKKQSIPTGRMKYKGWGSSRPISSNLSKWGRRNNRRVEILFLL